MSLFSCRSRFRQRCEHPIAIMSQKEVRKQTDLSGKNRDLQKTVLCYKNSGNFKMLDQLFKFMLKK